jgi:Kef-type K+ transport system membrane component KefB
LRPDHALLFVLLNIAIILIVARLCGAVFVRIGQPRVVGEIIAGVILGPSLLGPAIFEWTNPPAILDCGDALEAAGGGQKSITTCLFPPQSRPALGILGQIALTFFMFLVGLELNFNALKGRWFGIITVAVGVVAIPVVLGFPVAEALYNEKFVAGFGTGEAASKVAFALMLGAMMSVTAFPVMARILQEKGLQTSPMGVIGIAAAAVVTVLMFVMVSFAAGVAKDRSAVDHGIMIASVAVFIAIMFMIVRPLLERFLAPVYEERGLSGEIFAVIMIIVFLSAFIAQRLEVSVIVGGFLAGAVMPSRVRLFGDLSGRLSELTAVILLPIFLAFSGLQTDFTKLKPEFWGGIAIFLAVGIAAKWLGGLIAGKLGGLTWAEANVIGILMNCRGLLILVVALIALNEARVITPEMQVGGVLMALVTTMMTGPLFDRFLPLAVGTPPPAPEPAAAEMPVG